MSNTTWDRLVYGDEIQWVKREKSVPYVTKTIFASSLEDEQSDGWELLSEMKNPKKVKVKKDKPQDEIFEDTVWVLLANLGFTTMNRDQHFKMSYGNSPSQTQQIDVFAVDDETILFVECKLVGLCYYSWYQGNRNIWQELVKHFLGYVHARI